MPNLKASIKDERKTKRRSKQNLRIKRRYRKSVKDLNIQIDAENIKEAPKTLSQTYKLLDKAGKKKLLKPNTVSRKKSRLAKKLNKVIKGAADNVKNTKEDS